jgi:hypothetical protein
MECPLPGWLARGGCLKEGKQAWGKYKYQHIAQAE